MRPHFRVSICLYVMYAGDLRVVTNCGVLTEGFDAPVCDTIVMCRPTLSKGLYLQVPRHSHYSIMHTCTYPSVRLLNMALASAPRHID
jgi:hypothetical protein